MSIFRRAINWVVEILGLRKYSLEEYFKIIQNVANDVIIETERGGAFSYTGGKCIFQNVAGRNSVGINFVLFFAGAGEKYIQKSAQRNIPLSKFNKKAVAALCDGSEHEYSIDNPSGR